MTIRTGLPDGDSLYDVCVVGAGPLGLTVAQQCHARGQAVTLLECGGAGPEGSAAIPTYGVLNVTEI